MRGRVYLQSFMDALIAFSTYWAYLFVFILLQPGGSRAHEEALGAALFYSVTALVAIIVQGFRTISAKTEWWRGSWRASHELSFNQVLWVAVSLSLALVAIGDITTSRTFLLTWLLLLYLCLLVANRWLPAKIVETVYEGRRERMIFLGNMESTKALAGWREYQQRIGTEFIHYLPDFSIADMANLERLMRERNVTQLILMELPEVKFNLHYIMDVCERVGARLMLVSDLEQIFRHKLTVADDGGLRFITLEDEPLERAHNRFLKRLVDVALSLLILLLLWPVLLFVWLALRITSRQPSISREPRIGLKGEPLTILKFRTTSADASTNALERALCATRMDELPQLWNILRGEMSLIGPRPRLPEQAQEFARLMRNHHVRSEVKPGITGLAQVRGLRGKPHSEDEIARRVEADVAYVEKWSLGLDFAILWKTFWQNNQWAKGKGMKRSHV